MPITARLNIRKHLQTLE